MKKGLLTRFVFILGLLICFIIYNEQLPVLSISYNNEKVEVHQYPLN